MAGEDIRGYKVIQDLGSGGFGHTYKVSKDGKVYALKEILNDSELSKSANTDRIELECLALRILGANNKYVPQYYDHFEYQASAFIVQEFIDGRSLDKMIKDNDGNPVLFDQSRLTRFLFALLEILQYIHSNSFELRQPSLTSDGQRKLFIHRDIKPSNIIIKDNEYYLIDFGIAKIISYLTDMRSEPRTRGAGTPGYISPEVDEGRTPSPASDIYSLGVTAIQLATGIHPIRYSRKGEKFIWPVNSQDRIPARLRNLLLDMTQKSSEVRISSASIAIDRLKRVKQGIDNEGKAEIILKTLIRVFQVLLSKLFKREVIVFTATIGSVLLLLFLNHKTYGECEEDREGGYSRSGISQQVVSDLEESEYGEVSKGVQKTFTVSNHGCKLIIAGKRNILSEEMKEKIGESISDSVRDKISDIEYKYE